MDDKKTKEKNHIDLEVEKIDKVAVIGFFIGLGLYISTFFIQDSLIKTIVSMLALVLSGYHVISEGIIETIEHTKERRIFSPNVHILMTVAAIGAIIIGESNEAALLVIIFAGAHFLEDYAENRSKKEITNLLKITPQMARRIKKDGTIEVVDVKDIKIGDTLKVLKGDQVPTDGVIVKGASDLNEATITGESVPVFKRVNDNVFGAAINLSFDFDMKVTKDIRDTVIAKIIDLVSQSKKNISKTAKFIKKIEPTYVNTVLLLTPIFYLIGFYLFKWTQADTFYKTMVFLIATSPCALAVTDIPASLSAISNLARNGVLFKGGSYLSNLSDLKVVAFDKTGTLTEGKPVVIDRYITEEGSKKLDFYLSVLYGIESKSNHPLAIAVVNHLGWMKRIEIDIDVVPGIGIKAMYKNSEYMVAKPSYFKNLDKKIIELTKQFNYEGKTTVYFAKDNQVLMIFSLLDVPKKSVVPVMAYFSKVNIKTVMITGDQKGTADAIAKEININEAYANVLPSEKQEIVKKLQEQYGTTLMIGDGINDAPALKQADIGIAMKDGTDIAIDVADGVLMNNDLSKLSLAHKISRKLRRVVTQNIIFSMLIVITLVTLNILGILSLPLAVLIHEGSTVLVILSGLRLLIKMKEKKELNNTL